MGAGSPDGLCVTRVAWQGVALCRRWVPGGHCRGLGAGMALPIGVLGTRSATGCPHMGAASSGCYCHGDCSDGRWGPGVSPLGVSPYGHWVPTAAPPGCPHMGVVSSGRQCQRVPRYGHRVTERTLPGSATLGCWVPSVALPGASPHRRWVPAVPTGHLGWHRQKAAPYGCWVLRATATERPPVGALCPQSGIARGVSVEALAPRGPPLRAPGCHRQRAPRAPAHPVFAVRPVPGAAPRPTPRGAVTESRGTAAAAPYRSPRPARGGPGGGRRRRRRSAGLGAARCLRGPGRPRPAPQASPGRADRHEAERR